MDAMPGPTITRMGEDYLTLIWKAYEWPGSSASTTDLAASLGVTASTVSANLKKLARDGYIDYEPYGTITLTDQGREIAIATVRRHRIIETYLVQQLGLSWDQVHEEADQLEHAVSDLVLARMDEVLGFPAADPHGDPIPAPDGTITAPATKLLSELNAGDEGYLVRVSDRHADVLRYLDGKSLTVGSHIRVLGRSDAVGVVQLAHGDSQMELGYEAARQIRVSVGGN